MQLAKFITKISSVSGLELAMAQTCEKEPVKSSEGFFFEWLVALVVILGIVLVGFLALCFRFRRMERRVRALEMENQQGHQRFAKFLEERVCMEHDWCQGLERAICRSGGSVEIHELTNDEWRCVGFLNETNKRRILREVSFETSSYNGRYKNRMREMRRGNSPTRFRSSHPLPQMGPWIEQAEPSR